MEPHADVRKNKVALYVLLLKQSPKYNIKQNIKAKNGMNRILSHV